MDNNLPDLAANESVEDGHSNLKKLTQSYLLLKQKICETHEVIKQYNDKLKECERLKTDLDAATKQTKKVTCNYNSTLAKVIKLELQNTEYKKNIESLTTQVSDHQVKTAADQQHIQQLICKIKDIEGQQNDKIMQYDLEKSSLQVKVKELEQELKNVKKSYDMKIKKMEKKISVENSSTNTNNNSNSNSNGNSNNSSNNNKVKMKDIGTNTTLAKDEIVQKPEVIEKCVMTDEFYKVKDDIYPIFCAKCEVLVEPTPLEKICKIMTESCPRLIEKISSPPKKVPSLLHVSTDMNSDPCKTENLTTLPETPSSHLQNQSSHADFIPPNLLPSHTPIALNNTDYCNNFPRVSNLMNQSAYYIGSTPVNPLSLANSNTTNQNNHCDDMATVASSLSIISSLQKRIGTLETKIKKKFNKRKSEQNSNCWQHKHPNACYMYDINNSMQLNFIELWKRMADFYGNKQTKQFDVNKRSNKSSSKRRSSSLKPVKRLQNTYTGSWKVETVVRKVEQSPLRKRCKKRKRRHSMLLNKSDVLLNNTEDLEKSTSDSDTNPYNDLFNDNARINTDVGVECNSHSKSNTGLKTSTCSMRSTEIDEAEVAEAIQNSVESNKSVGGETDSGILSDSVESTKLVQLEADIDACLDSRECKNTTEVKSSTGNISYFTGNVKLVEPQFPGNSPIKVTKSGRLIETSINSEISKSDGQSKRTEDEKGTEVSQHNGLISQMKSTSNINSTRKRKISELQESNKCSSRQDLLKKLRNLKKSSKIGITIQNVSNHQEVQNYEHKNSFASQDEKYLANGMESVKEDDCMPKKRPRIAHVPKSTVNEQKNSVYNYAHLGKRLVKNIASAKIKARAIAGNSIESDTNTAVEQTKILRRNCVTINKSSLVSQKTTKEDSNEELEKKCNSRIEELKPDLFNTVDPNIPDVIENDNFNGVTIADIKHSSKSELEIKSSSGIDMDSSGNSDTFTKSSVNDSFEELMELNEMKTELNEECESLKQEYENNSPDTKEVVTEIDNNIYKSSYCDDQLRNNVNTHLSSNETHFGQDSFSQVDLQLSHDKSSHPGSVTNSKTNLGVSNESIEEVKNEQSYTHNLLLDSQYTNSIIAEESDIKERNIGINETTNACTMEVNSHKILKSKSHCPLVKLKQYIAQSKCPNKNCKSQFKKLFHVRLITDKFIKKQLQRLVDSDWQTSLHWDVIEKLKSTCSARIIAKGIVDFLSTEQECNKSLDNSHTPPAPLMTKTQQRIAALLIDLEESKPMVLHFVQAGIEYKLFRLNQTIERSVVESLARMYTVLARIKKDREKVRIFCCDALYCLGLNATLVLYTVFTCWPEVFPNNETNIELLPKCMAHLITAQQATDFPKLNALKNLVSVFYRYQMGSVSKDVLQDLLTALQQTSGTEVETAIILLAKREGTAWTYKNIIRGALLPMIINNKLPSTYRAFCLLGNLMRVFPVDDKDNSVGEIVEQLRDLINSGEGSDEQQEGVISALLSLSRHKFDEVVQCVIKWTPAAPLHVRTMEQINGLYNSRGADFWKGYLKKSKHLQQTCKQSKT